MIKKKTYLVKLNTRKKIPELAVLSSSTPIFNSFFSLPQSQKKTFGNFCIALLPVKQTSAKENNAFLVAVPVHITQDVKHL